MDIDVSQITGISQSALVEIKSAIFSEQDVAEAVIFGSRAKGTWKEFSDIDISLKGENVTHQTIVNILNRLQDTDIPYIIDLNRYDAITNEALRSHIDRIGIRL